MYTNPHPDQIEPLAQRGQPPWWALQNSSTRRLFISVVGGLMVWVYCLLVLSFLM